MSEANATAPAASDSPITVTQVPIAPVPEGINIQEAIAILNGGHPVEKGDETGAAATTTAPPAIPAGETPDDPEAGITVEVPAAAATPAAPAAPSADDVKAEIAAIATDYGIDPAILTQFPDVESAYTAITLFANQYANVGIDTGGPSGAPPAQAAAPAAPATPAVDALNFELDESALDDKSVAAFNALKAALVEERKRNTSVEEKVNAIAQFHASEHKRQLHARAAAVVDSFGSEKYGTSANRTAAQRLNVNRLYALADNLQIGLESKGLVVPDIEQVLLQVALSEGVRRPSKTAPGATPAAVPPAVVAPPAAKKAPAAPRPLVPATVSLSKDSHLGNLHKDPAFMGAVSRILSRPS